MSSSNNINYHKIAVQHIEKYLSIPKDMETSPDNLTFDQLLGKELYDTLSVNAASAIDKLFNKEKIVRGSYNNYQNEDDDPALADQHKYENKFDGIIRLLKQYGHEFTEDNLIDAGVNSRRQEYEFRNIDSNDEYIAPIHESELQTMNKDSTIIEQLGAGVIYHNITDDDIHNIVYSNTEKKFLITYDIDYKEITLMFEDDLQLQEFLYHAGDTSVLDGSYITNQDAEVETPAICLDKTDRNLKPLLQLLQNQNLINHASSIVFEKSVNEQSKDHKR